MHKILSPQQHTLENAVACTGVGLHTGKPVKMTLRPAAADTGIVFKRLDVAARTAVVPARYDLVTHTELGTTLTNEHGVSVSTVEHLMAALWGMGVDNAVIELDGPEVPIMDGSSEPFVFLIECARMAEQTAQREFIEVSKPLMVREGGSSLMIEPAEGFSVAIDIDFPHALIAHQSATYDFTETSFKQILSRARTFGFEKDVEALRAKGLALGGSLENAIVLGDKRIVNEEGLRYADEFVRHKALDLVGDLFLAGARIKGHITAQRPGHKINNKLLRQLLGSLHAAAPRPIAYRDARIEARLN